MVGVRDAILSTWKEGTLLGWKTYVKKYVFLFLLCANKGMDVEGVIRLYRKWWPNESAADGK